MTASALSSPSAALVALAALLAGCDGPTTEEVTPHAYLHTEIRMSDGSPPPNLSVRLGSSWVGCDSTRVAYPYASEPLDASSPELWQQGSFQTLGERRYRISLSSVEREKTIRCVSLAIGRPPYTGPQPSVPPDGWEPDTLAVFPVAVPLRYRPPYASARVSVVLNGPRE